MPVRISTITPRSLPNLKLWLDASQAKGAGVANYSHGQSVSQWNDLSGNNYHATQATTASQPTFLQNAVNGNPVLRFDGTNDKMTSAFTISGTHTIFAVYANTRSTVIATVDTLYSTTTVGGSTAQGFTLETSNGYFSTAARYMAYEGSVVSANKYTAYVNGKTVANFAHINNLNQFYCSTTVWREAPAQASITFCGPNYTLNGLWGKNDVAEIIVYGAELTASQIKAVEQYLKFKYTI